MACCFQSNHRTSRWMRASRTLLEVFELERKPWGPNISERCFQVSIWRYLVPVLVAGSCRRFWFYGCTPTNQMSKRRNRRVEMRQELWMHLGCDSKALNRSASDASSPNSVNTRHCGSSLWFYGAFEALSFAKSESFNSKWLSEIISDKFRCRQARSSTRHCGAAEFENNNSNLFFSNSFEFFQILSPEISPNLHCLTPLPSLIFCQITLSPAF